VSFVSGDQDKRHEWRIGFRNHEVAPPIKQLFKATVTLFIPFGLGALDLRSRGAPLTIEQSI
jgi:hypothetical protein